MMSWLNKALLCAIVMSYSAPTNIDPVGRYELAATMRGKSATLIANITKLDDGSFGGELSGKSINTVKIIDVRVADSTVKFAINATEEIRANFRLVISGDSVSGDWSMPGDGSEVHGRRGPPGGR